ncbi:MAG: PHB depolymerase family esterase [Paracoccaceae bacterium]
MKLFPNGPNGRRIPLAPSAIPGSAAALVQQTLAQHGLAAPGLLGGHPAQMPSDLPKGARFDRDQFACGAGQRDYWLYTPGSAKDGGAGLVVMLHGCTQTPQDFAAGTGMNQHAERHGLSVLYPAQSRGANAQSCWNWFSQADQRRDRGEPAILSGMARQIVANQNIPPSRIYVAGLSAGGAMAVILGEAYPDLFAAVGAHSALPFGVASDVASAFSAMAGHPTKGGLTTTSGIKSPTIVFHGTADTTVHPNNGQRIAKDATSHGMAQVQTVEHGRTGGRSFSRAITSSDPGQLVEHWVVEGLGHAWSGGQDAGSYTDTKGPDASAEMVRFFLQADKEKV